MSLKAEVLRKQNEISKVKSENNARIIKQTRKITPLILKNKGVEGRAGYDVHEEDEDLLKNSRYSYIPYSYQVYYNKFTGPHWKLKQSCMIN